MRVDKNSAILALIGLAFVGCSSAPRTADREPETGAKEKKLTAKTYNSNFKLAHDTYNGMGTGSDGKN